jgi:hypothetical protein
MASSTSNYVRRAVLIASSLLGSVGLFWIGRSFFIDGKLHLGNPVGQELSGISENESPRVVRAEVTLAEGNTGVRIGDKCEFLVRRHLTDGSFECNAQVMCSEHLLYGGPMRGYFPCKLYEGDRRDVVGTDAATTEQDQDGAFVLDTRSGVMRIWDDARGTAGKFKIEADIISVQ